MGPLISPPTPARGEDEQQPGGQRARLARSRSYRRYYNTKQQLKQKPPPRAGEEVEGGNIPPFTN
jgi:hypothetical protein